MDRIGEEGRALAMPISAKETLGWFIDGMGSIIGWRDSLDRLTDDVPVYCPVCAAECVQEKCKVICRSDKCRGRVVMNCSEF